MLEYVYIVKCPNCEDEHFYFFNDAKEFAMSSLSRKPIITQVEVNRNDFGECTDSADLGTVWSWEEMMQTDDEPAKAIFTKDDLELMADGKDPEFDELDDSIEPDIRKPVPEDMSIEDLVEAMEENEDEVECALCNELFPKAECIYDEDEGYICEQCKEETVKCTWCGFHYDPSECRKEVDLGWLCRGCEMAIKSRGETLTFIEGSYWDLLDESTTSHSDVFTEAIDLNGPTGEALVKIFNDVADQLDAEDKSKVISKLLRYVTPDKIESVWAAIKDHFEDRVLTEEDKDVLVRKLNINRNLLDGVDTVLTAVDAVRSVTPTVLGTLIDILELTPIEDALVGVATGGVGVLITTILSVIPEGALIGALSSLEYEIKHDILQKVKDILVHKVLPEPKATLGESVDPRELVELEYPELTVTLFGPQRDVDDWDEVEHTTSHTFLVPKVEVAVAIWENWITEEDAKDVEGGLETLEDDIAWEKFLETHFDDLFEKYRNEVLKYFEEDAIEDFRERSQEEYDLERWSAKNKHVSYLEDLEDPEAYSERLADCPECGAVQSFDHETGICINCGFNI